MVCIGVWMSASTKTTVGFARGLRRLALNLLKKDKTFKVGLKTKACSGDHQYLLNILTQ
jgi:hypothetical protein